MNRSWQIKTGLVVVIILLSIYGLIPTYRAARIPASERALARSDSALVDPKVRELREKIARIDAKAIRRGLDLQGGMYLVYEVDQAGMTNDEAHDALERVQEILRNRVDQFGVSEPVIQTQGTSRIIVQLPGVQDPDRVRKLIGQTARLEFRLVRPREDYESALAKLDEAFRVAAGQKKSAADSLQTDAGEAELAPETGPADTASAAADSLQLAEGKTAGDSTAASPFGELPAMPVPSGGEVNEEDPYVKEHPFSAFVQLDPDLGRGLGLRHAEGTYLFVEEDNRPRVEWMLSAPEAKVLPRTMEFQFGSESARSSSGQQLRPLYLLDATPSLTGDRLSGARITPDNQRMGSWQVDMTLDRKGARQFSKVTGENVQRFLAISLDGMVDCAPVIQSKIPDGRAQITGNYTNQEASDLALLLRAGALPTDVKLEMERTVGPSLGRDSIRRGVNAALVGSVIVILFILLYYKLTGGIAIAALICNMLIMLAVLGQFGLVLTLPGIAGIVLTIGMAVDANVLINERIREELRKNKTVRAAVDAGYANATRTIVDANVTTLIAGGILLYFGTGPIKGFAVTLSIGILTSMFTALVMTRVIMEYLTRKKQIQKLSI